MSPSPPTDKRATCPDGSEEAQLRFGVGAEDGNPRTSRFDFPSTHGLGRKPEDLNKSEVQLSANPLLRSHQEKENWSLSPGNVLDHLELASGFQFAPPVTLAPGQFTRRTIVSTRLDQVPVSQPAPQLDVGVGNSQVGHSTGIPGEGPREPSIPAPLRTGLPSSLPGQDIMLEHDPQALSVSQLSLPALPSPPETHRRATRHEDQHLNPKRHHGPFESGLSRQPFADTTAPLPNLTPQRVQDPVVSRLPTPFPGEKQTRSPQDHSAFVGLHRTSPEPGPWKTPYNNSSSDPAPVAALSNQPGNYHHMPELGSRDRTGSNEPSVVGDLQFSVSRDTTSGARRDSSRKDPRKQTSSGRAIARSRSQSSPISNISKLRSMPTRHGKAKLDMVKQFGSHFANSWNSYVQDVNKAEEELEAEFIYRLDKLRRKNEDQAQQIKGYLQQVDSQARSIESLEEEKEDLVGHVTNTEDKLQRCSDRIQKLDEKCRSYRNRLNAAVEEQQQLYTHSKKACQDAVDQMRAQEQLQATSMELARQKAEELREQIIEKVRVAVSQSKDENSSCKSPVLSVLRQN